MNKKLNIRNAALTFTAFSLFAAGLLSACQTAAPTAAPSEAPAEATVTGPLKIKIGVSPVPHGDIVNFVKENLAEAAGLEIEVIELMIMYCRTCRSMTSRLTSTSFNTCLT